MNDHEYHRGDPDLNDGAAGFILKKHCGPLAILKRLWCVMKAN